MASTLTPLVDGAIGRAHATAATALANGRPAAAVVSISRAIYLHPASAELVAARAEAHLQLCDLQSAISNLRKALKLSLSAERDADAAAADDAGGGDAGGSAAGAAAADAGSGRASARYAARLARVLDLRAVSLIEDGAHAEAAPLLSEGIALDGALRSLWLHRALARTGLGEYADALADLATCIEMDPSDADVHFLRAKLSLLAGDLPAARRVRTHARERARTLPGLMCLPAPCVDWDVRLGCCASPRSFALTRPALEALALCTGRGRCAPSAVRSRGGG